MLSFDSSDPFPLLAQEIPYAEEKLHSEAVDAWLGIKVASAEAQLGPVSANQERWEKQGPAVFMTPYTELRKILTELSPKGGQLVIDLGAGYGRMGFVLKSHFPEVRFIGYELVAQRVEEGRLALSAHACKNA
ncbi:MAG: class I SAM-dependent methyltransferase, partial [Bdellovibrionota bacterium]